MRLSPPRGSILVATMVILVVLLVLVVGALAFTGKNRNAAVSTMRAEELSACAEAARKHLLSRLRLFNVPVSEIVLNTEIPNGEGTLRISTSHYGQAAPTPADGIMRVVPLAAAAVVGTDNLPSDGANVTTGNAAGGQFYGTVVKCTDSAGRETELEFAFRYGF